MSTCPDLELQSAFFDGEIGLPWYDEIKTHVEACPECKARMDGMKAVRSAFAADSASLNLSAAQLDESFDRLQSRLRYTKTAAKSNVIRADFTRKLIPYAAAAVFLAAFIIPAASLRLQVKQQLGDVAWLLPNSRVELIDKSGVAADGSINVAAVKVSNTAGSSAAPAAPVALHVSNLTQVDLFKPELSANQAPVVVPLPSVKEMPLADVSELPLINAEAPQAGIFSADVYR